MNNREILLGCVADDFTGASDAASFLVSEGLKTVLFNGVPEESIEIESCDAVVIALKTRSIEKGKAVQDTLCAIKWFQKKCVKQYYIKYCSTFDSTKEGNIGPIADGAMEYLDEKYTILCPALPVNKRTVKEGILYVDNIPLSESHMKTHPLNPMWASKISELMGPQSKYQCMNINYDVLESKTKKEILDTIEQFGQNKEHFYVIPDYMSEQNGQKIADVFGDLKLLTGGSGILSPVAKRYVLNEKVKMETKTYGQGIVLAGSCSKATLEQIEVYKKSGGSYFKIEPLKLLKGEITLKDIWDFVEKNKQKPVLLYSSDDAQNIQKNQESGKEAISQLLENTMAEIAKESIKNNFKRIIVAGGETSGAVTVGLGFDCFYIGESIAPGVPVMIPVKQPDIRLVLKSGNFGEANFFLKALELTEG